MKKPSKPREPGAKRTFVPKSERTKLENAKKAKLSRLAASIARLQGKL